MTLEVIMKRGGLLNKPLLSVIVPVYNTEKYLGRCLDSILRQSYDNLEVIIIDDGSTDGSYNIAKSYAKKDARIRLFLQMNCGVTVARIQGIKNALGKWIGFVDSDDYIEPYMFELLTNCMANQKCDLVSAATYAHTLQGVVLVEGDNYLPGLYINLPEEIYPTMLHDFKIDFKGLRCQLFTKLFLAEILKGILDELDSRVFYEEDAMILYRYCLACSSIYIMHEPVYHYVHRRDSAQQETREGEADSFYYLFKNLAAAFQKSPYRTLLMRQLYQHVLLKMEERIFHGLYGMNVSVLDVWDFNSYRQVFGKQVLVYGAGLCGKAFYKELLRRGYQKSIVAWVDKAPKEASAESIHRVEPVEAIRGKAYDYVAVAIKNKEKAQEAIKELQEKWSVPAEKIVWGESSCRNNWHTAYI